LVHILESSDLLVEGLTLLNSPYWTVTLEAVRAEVTNINILVDRKYQTSLLDQTRTTAGIITETERMLGNVHVPFPIDDLPDWITRKFHQPQDLNTDGIDPIGQDIWVHDCVVMNADDSVAVKPMHRHDKPAFSIIPNCTRNVTIENMVLTGFGASVGSVGPSDRHPCVDNITFRNISMPGTGKVCMYFCSCGWCGSRTSLAHRLFDFVHIGHLHQI
jgi:polygalacturonase